MIAIVTHFYADLPKGTSGEVVKSWTDPKGCKWHRLFLGTNRSGKKLQKVIPEDCLKLITPFKSTHELDFEVADWYADPEMKLYRIGTCEGLWMSTPESYCIISVISSQPGNGHLDDVFEWFENSCKRDGKSLKVLELFNERFEHHLKNKRGFIGEYNLEKKF